MELTPSQHFNQLNLRTASTQRPRGPFGTSVHFLAEIKKKKDGGFMSPFFFLFQPLQIRSNCYDIEVLFLCFILPNILSAAPPPLYLISVAN